MINFQENQERRMIGMSNSEDYLHLDRTNLMNELRDLSAKYNQTYAIQLQTETRTKELNAGLFIKYKTGQEKISVKEIEAKIILDPHMAQQRLKDDEAKKNYLKAKTDYNNMLTEISLLQSELKRELQLMGKERYCYILENQNLIGKQSNSNIDVSGFAS